MDELAIISYNYYIKRENYQHKLANKLVKDYDKICVEDLDIKNMLEAKCFKVKKSNIQDASWRKFIEKLVYI